MDINSVIIAPVITEKSTKDVANNRFTFCVNTKANKHLIRKAIEEKFKVNVVDIATSIVKGKKARQGKRRIEVLKPEWKKATVALKEGQKISLFETGGAK